VRSALSYFPGRSPLHRANPGPAIAYLGSFVIVTFVFPSPLVLAAVGVSVALVGVAAGAGRAIRASLRLAIPLMLLMIAVNALVSHRGDTILVRGWEVPVLGRMDVTLESLAEGARIGLLVVVVILTFAVYSACVDPDRVLRALRPIARRSALTAALVARMVPLAAADFARLSEASALRGPAAEPVGRAALMRRLVEGSLDRSVDVAATLELRGHSLPGGARPATRHSRDDTPLLAAAALVIAATVGGLLAGAGGFETYPRIELATGPATLTLCAALPLLAALPFAVRTLRASGGAVRHA
jgi:energy-coupling factor transport system permease protein